MNLRWFFSRTVRQATQIYRHVRKILNAQRDILSPAAVSAIEQSLAEVQQATRTHSSQEELLEKVAALEKTAVSRLKPYPHAAFRENVEVLLVAIAVAMGIRTFFLQPFKIPTGSMQPTLYGITPSENSPPQDPQSMSIPGPVQRFFQFWISGISYTHIVAEADGRLEQVKPPQRFLLFNLRQQFKVGPEWYTVWFPPDGLLNRAGLADRTSLSPRFFRKGEDIIKLKVVSGDHLFVDRMSYNFRRPQRGEIIVFETTGIAALPQDQFYIKRLIALGEEKVQIGDDRRVIINGRRLDASTPHFELVYSFTGPPRDSVYSGHLNEVTAERYGYHNLARYFPNSNAVFTVQPDHYIVMGDNTVNSSDSRTWGDFPRENVIGKSYFVYWPIGPQDERPSRFGWGYR